MSKITSLLFIFALISLVEGKFFLKNLANHIKDKVNQIHDKVHEDVNKVHDKVHEKVEEIKEDIKEHHDKHHNKHHDKNQNNKDEEQAINSPFPQQPEDWQGPKLKAKPSTLYFNMDDQITHLYINQNRIHLQPIGNEDKEWSKTKTMKMYLYEGDTIKVVGKDLYEGLAGFLGSIHFYNKKGKEKIYSTGKGWYCNGKPAVIKSENNGSVEGWPYMPLIEKDAQWIWNTPKTIKEEAVTCVFKIPCKKH